jgi:hypothetical protein
VSEDQEPIEGELVDPATAGAELVLPQPPQGWEPPQQYRVVYRLISLSHMLDAARMELDSLDENRVAAKQKWLTAHAEALLTSTQRSVQTRNAEADLACSDLHFDWQSKEQLVRACKERISTIREQIDIGQSLNAAVNAEMRASGWTGGGPQ